MAVRRIFLIFGFLIMLSCHQESNFQNDCLGDGNSLTLTASFAEHCNAKTVLQENETDVYWSVKDTINLFQGSRYSGVFISTNTKPAPVAGFAGKLECKDATGGAPASDTYWAVYPYNAGNTCDGESVTLTLPFEQAGSEGTFAEHLLPAIASGNNTSLGFYNVCGGACFSLENEGVEKVTFRSLDGTPLSGRIRASFDDEHRPVVMEILEARDSVVIQAPEGGFEPELNYFAVMLPGLHKQGLSVSLYINGKHVTKSLDKPIHVKRGVFGRLPALDDRLGHFEVAPPVVEITPEGAISVLSVEGLQYLYSMTSDGTLPGMPNVPLLPDEGIALPYSGTYKIRISATNEFGVSAETRAQYRLFVQKNTIPSGTQVVVGAGENNETEFSPFAVTNSHETIDFQISRGMNGAFWKFGKTNNVSPQTYLWVGLETEYASRLSFHTFLRVPKKMYIRYDGIRSGQAPDGVEIIGPTEVSAAQNWSSWWGPVQQVSVGKKVECSVGGEGEIKGWGVLEQGFEAFNPPEGQQGEDEGLFLDHYKVPEAGNVGAALCLRGNNLYCVSGGFVQVYDVTEPMAPRLRSFCTIPGSGRQVVADERGIFVSARGGGVFIIDASNLDAIQYLGRYDTIELATGIDIAGDVLFVTLRGYGVEFIDVRDLNHPQHIFCQKTPESQSCWYQDGYLYSGEWGVGQVTTLDASDMSEIKVLSSNNLYGCGDGLSTLGDRLYVATGHHARHSSLSGDAATGAGHGVDIFDISNPSKPAFISRVQFDVFFQGGLGDWWTVRPSSDGKTLFAADSFNGLYSVDISNERSPRIVDHLTLPDTFVSSVAVGDGVVYVTGQHYGLLAVRCKAAKIVNRTLGRLPVHSEARYAYPTSAESHFTAWKPDARGQVKALAVAGDKLLAACSDAGLYVLKKDTSGHLSQLSRGPMAFAGDVSYRNGRVFVAEGTAGLGIYSLGGDGGLIQEARLTDFGYESFKLCVWANAVSDRYVIVNDRNSTGYVVLDIRDYPVIRPVLRHNVGSPWYDKFIAAEPTPSGYLACPSNNKGLSWIYLGNDKVSSGKLYKSIVPVMSSASPFRGESVILCTKSSGTFLTQISYPDTIVAQSKSGDFAGSIAWDGDNHLAVTFRQVKKIKKTDVSTVEGAHNIWVETTEGHPDRAVFWDGKIYVPAGYQGVLIEK